MSRQTADRDEVALRHLTLLARELGRFGLRTDITPQRQHQPFPGLTVTSEAASAVILAGSVHFWRQAPERDLKLIGPLDDPAATARAVHKHLTDKRRHAHERAKR